MMGLWETETCRVKIKEINTQNKQLHPLVTLLQYWPWLISNLTHKILIYLHIIHLLKSSHETCQWLKFPPNVLRAQSRVSPVVGLLPSASGPAYLGMAFPPFLMKQLYRCDSVVISSFVRTGYTTRRWGWLLGRIGYRITHHYPLYKLQRN